MTSDQVFSLDTYLSIYIYQNRDENIRHVCEGLASLSRLYLNITSSTIFSITIEKNADMYNQLKVTGKIEVLHVLLISLYTLDTLNEKFLRSECEDLRAS